MSLTDNFRRNKPGAGRPPTYTAPLAPPLRDKLGAVRHQIEQLGPKIEQLSLAVTLGEVDRSALDSENATLDALKVQERTLTAALAEAERVDRAAMIKRRSAQRAKELAALKQAVADRDAAAKAFTSAITAAADAFHKLLDANTAIIRGVPFGDQLPASAEFSVRALRNAVAAEMARVSASPGDQNGRALPGSEAGSQLLKFQPENIPPLADVIAKSGAFVLRELTESVAANPAGLPPAKDASEVAADATAG